MPINTKCRYRRIMRHTLCFFMVFVMTFACLSVFASGKLSDKYPSGSEDTQSVVYERKPWYSQIFDEWQKQGYQPAAQTTEPIELAVQSFSAYQGDKPEKNNIDNQAGIRWETSTQWIEWDVTVKQAGLYQLEIVYYPEDGSGLPIQRGILLNGEVPFDEAEAVIFPRRFSETGHPRINSLGDEVRPQQEEKREWITYRVSDMQGKYVDALSWMLKEGKQTFRLTFIDQPVIIKSIRFCPPKEVPSYQQMKQVYDQEGYKEASKEYMVQAEDTDRCDYKTQGSITMYSDGDPITSPQSVTNIKMNAMGGYSWRESNQEISYEIDVPQTGLYKLAMRVSQIWGNGMSSCRQILIDDEIPFREMGEYQFPYSRDWYLEVLSDEQDVPYLFYLTQGKHTITMKVKLGEDIAKALELMTLASDRMSEMIRKITMITGQSPDPNYDYELDKAITDLLDTFGDINGKLKEASQHIMHISNKRPSVVNNLEMTSKQLQEMIKKPGSIPKRLGDLSGGLTNLGDCIRALKEQPLGIDYFTLCPPDKVLPRGTSGTLIKIWATIRNFIASFGKDYNAIGSIGEQGEVEKVLSVWISRGKEWSEILQELADISFTPETGLGIKLNILPSGTLSSAVNPLLLAINSGNAPDVALSLPSNLPVEYAIRDSVSDLSHMPDFDKTAAQFDSKIFTPFKYREGVYALPETTNFRVLFYRTDIMGELKLKVPETWDETFRDLLPVLYQNGMQMYVPSAFDLFLFQEGGTMYSQDGLRSALDSPESYTAFNRLVSLYTELGFPIAANFFNRFRSGEMPIGIESYSMYITLMTAAPELAGKWSIAPLPGTISKSGEIDRSSTTITGEGDIILQQSKNKKDAWKFLQWWTSEQTQSEFGIQVEGRIGTYARWNTANLKAFSSLPWSKEHLSVIKEQWKWSEDPPTVLGGYYTNRHISNAFYRCVYSNSPPRDSLEEAVEQINKELVRKQGLYGIYRQDRGDD